MITGKLFWTFSYMNSIAAFGQYYSFVFPLIFSSFMAASQESKVIIPLYIFFISRSV